MPTVARSPWHRSATRQAKLQAGVGGFSVKQVDARESSDAAEGKPISSRSTDLSGVLYCSFCLSVDSTSALRRSRKVY